MLLPGEKETNVPRLRSFAKGEKSEAKLHPYLFA